jgi:hypothetical protein
MSTTTSHTVHDLDFRQAEKDWGTFVEKMTETLITIDSTIPELPIKDVVSVPPLEYRPSQRAVRIAEQCVDQREFMCPDLSHLTGCTVLQRSNAL